jgi:hypothetical protein
MEDLNDNSQSAFIAILDRENRMRRLEANYITDRYFCGLDLGQSQDLHGYFDSQGHARSRNASYHSLREIASRYKLSQCGSESQIIASDS